MAYMDEKIINLRNEYKQQIEQNKNIEEQLAEKGIEFKERDFFNNQFRIILPEYMQPLNTKNIQIKYPSQNRPPVILADLADTINFTFNLLEQPLNNAYVPEALHAIKQLTKRLNPANVFYKEETLKNKNLVIGYFDYKSYAIDEDVYNIMFVLPVNNKTLLGTFNCKHSDYKIWKPLILEIIKTSQDLMLEDGDE